jgi:hypothetical protein
MTCMCSERGACCWYGTGRALCAVGSLGKLGLTWWFVVMWTSNCCVDDASCRAVPTCQQQQHGARVCSSLQANPTPAELRPLACAPHSAGCPTSLGAGGDSRGQILPAASVSATQPTALVVDQVCQCLGHRCCARERYCVPTLLWCAWTAGEGLQECSWKQVVSLVSLVSLAL